MTKNNILPALMLMLATFSFGASQATAANSYKEVQKMNLMPMKSVDHLQLPGINLNKALVEAAEDEVAGLHKFAEAYALQTDTKQNGTWEFTEDGRSVWRVSVTSPAAMHLNFGFSQYKMPEGGELVIYTPKGGDFIGPFTSKDNAAHHELWTPILAGDTAIIQVTLPSESVDKLELEIGTVNHGFKNVGGTPGAKSGSCNVDVICSQGDLWREQIAAVGAYSISGTFFCSGTLINNTANDQTPYFLTANHCGVNTNNDQAVVVYWNYQNTTCRAPGSGASGGNGNGSLSQFSSGTIWRASNSLSDFALIEMEEPLELSHNLFFAGWDRSSTIPTNAIGIHHPGVEEKRISFEDDPLSITDYGPSPLGVLNFFQITDWDLGTTEGGSSGSGLFNPDKRLIGQLYGGFAACGNDSADWYGGIFASWEGGGTPSSRLKDWLDPLNTGVTTLDGILATEDQLIISSVSSLDDSHYGDGDQLLEPGESGVKFNVNLLNRTLSEATNVMMTITSDIEGLTFEVEKSAFSSFARGVVQESESQFVVSYSALGECRNRINVTANITAVISGEPFQSTQIITLSGATFCDVVPNLSLSVTNFDDSASNNNEVVETGENGIIPVLSISNIGAPLNNAAVTLALVSGAGTIVQASDTVSIPTNGTVQVDALSFNVHPNAACLSRLNLMANIDDGQTVFSFPFSITIGVAEKALSSSQNPNITYGDVGLPRMLQQTFNVAAEGDVLDLNIMVDIDHTWVSDNVFSITSPSGTKVFLFQGHGGDDENGFSNVIFDDQASVSIVDAPTPYSGAYMPTGSLSAFNGEPITGEWVMEFIDDADLDEGTINSIQFELLYSSIECDGPFFPELWLIE